MLKHNNNFLLPRLQKLFNTLIPCVLLIGLLTMGPPLRTSLAQSASPEISLEKKVGQMLKIGFRGMEVSDTNHIVRDISEYHLGGVVLFDYDVPRDTSYRNVESPKQLEALVADLQKLTEVPLIVAIDQEGGKVARLKPRYGFPASVSAQYLGQTNNPDTTQFYAQQAAKLLSDLGINVNLAPVVDVNVNPQNPIIGGLERSFSSNPEIVTEHARIYIETLNKHDVFTVLKHFPGHGSSENDSHLGVVDVTDHWSEKELIPYQKLIDTGIADMVMTAHIFNEQWDTSYPATLSKTVITGMLRKEIGFDGIVMSDDLMMGAIRDEYGLQTTIKQALHAGVDILSFGNNSIYDPEIVPKAHGIIMDLVESGEIEPERIDRSYQRIMKLKGQLK